MLERQTYYDLLGVDYDASRAEIRAAYEHLLQVYRDNPEMLRQIKLGWAVLTKPVVVSSHISNPEHNLQHFKH